MRDVQGDADSRGISIGQAGVRDLRYPILLHEESGSARETVATVSMSVAVSAEDRGTHMSRLVEVLHAHASRMSISGISAILSSLNSRLRTDSSRVSMQFPYSMPCTSPTTAHVSYSVVDAGLVGCRTGSEELLGMNVTVPVTTVCPCSKAISDYGAHNQRGMVSIGVSFSNTNRAWPVKFAALIAIAENAASAPVYPLIKRPDERDLTMAAHDRPAFVEDVVRDCALALQSLPAVERFNVEVVNLESIHAHNAFARVEWPPAPPLSMATAPAEFLVAGRSAAWI